MNRRKTFDKKGQEEKRGGTVGKRIPERKF